MFGLELVVFPAVVVTAFAVVAVVAGRDGRGVRRSSRGGGSRSSRGSARDVAAETMRMLQVQGALGAAFPDADLRVRCESTADLPAIIRVSWSDGPSEAAVAATVRRKRRYGRCQLRRNVSTLLIAHHAADLRRRNEAVTAAQVIDAVFHADAPASYGALTRAVAAAVKETDDRWALFDTDPYLGFGMTPTYTDRVTDVIRPLERILALPAAAVDIVVTFIGDGMRVDDAFDATRAIVENAVASAT